MPKVALDGQVILVTGAAGGIGGATAAELARRGARLALADLDPAGLESAGAAIGGEVLTIRLDVTDRDACVAAVAQTVERFGRLDAVWANAGIAAFGPLELVEPAVWHKVVEVNLTGAYNTIHSALPAIIEARGYVAVTASVASFAHPPGLSAYAASKAGVEALANALRSEVAHQGVRVGTIHPTWVDTDLVRYQSENSPAYRALRAIMRPPFKKTIALERVVPDIADAFARRPQRVCIPGVVRMAHLLRPAVTTRAFTGQFQKAAPDIRRLFAEQLAAEGGRAALGPAALAQVAEDERAEPVR